MELQHSDIGDVRKVTLTGRLDTTGVDRVGLQFDALVVPAGKNTVVDMSEVSFLGSLGVRMLLSTSRALSRKGGKFVLYAVSPPVLEVITTMGFDDIVTLAGTESEAIALVTA